MVRTEIRSFENRSDLESHVESTFKSLIEVHFAGLYEYCLQTGSFVYGGGTPGKSDLDITVVFKDDIYHSTKEGLLKKVESFIEGYLKLHQETGFSPDLTFPGEYITLSIIKDAVKGRGYHVDSDGKLYLPKASTDYYLEDPERWFRAWRSQSVFNRFLAGDRQLFERNKIGAWTSILKFVLSNQNPQSITVDELFSRLRSFGVHDDYWNFRTLEENWITRSLQGMIDQGFVTEASKGFYIPAQDKLQKWSQELASQIATGGIKNAPLLLGPDETLALAQYASRMWKKILDE